MGGESKNGLGAKLPIEHLSASSINLWLRCNRQWQAKYIFHAPTSSNSALILGSAVHLGLSRALMGEGQGDYFDEVVESENESVEFIEWKDKPDVVRKKAERHIDNYLLAVAPYLGHIEETEKELEVIVPGVPIPVVGFIDIETKSRLIDVKTTGYFKRNPELNPEWSLQARIYQAAVQKPAEFHILTNSDKFPIVTPSDSDDPLYLASPGKPTKLFNFIQQVYDEMTHAWEKWGDEPWPGVPTHPWSYKYCGVENCCHVCRGGLS